MEIRDYERLIMIHDKMDGIEKVEKTLFGEACATGFEDGLFGRLTYIEEILKDNIAEKFRHDERKDFFQREWYGILCDKSKTARERAEILLGIEKTL